MATVDESLEIAQFGSDGADDIIAVLDEVLEEDLPKELEDKILICIDEIQNHRNRIQSVHGSAATASARQQSGIPSNSTNSFTVLLETIEKAGLLNKHTTADAVGDLNESDQVMHRLMWSFRYASQATYDFLFKKLVKKRKHLKVES